MSATATTPGRQVYPATCPIHRIEYGRQLVPSTPQHESYLVGNCPKCEPRLRRELEWDEEKPARLEEVSREVDGLIAADEGYEARRNELARTWLSEDAQSLVDKWLAANRQEYEDAADKQMQGELIEKVLREKWDAFFAEVEGVK